MKKEINATDGDLQLASKLGLRPSSSGQHVLNVIGDYRACATAGATHSLKTRDTLVCARMTGDGGTLGLLAIARASRQTGDTICSARLAASGVATCCGC